jgi:hypothetical protein
VKGLARCRVCLGAAALAEGKLMEQLNVAMDVLRKAAIERVGKAIDDEAVKGKGKIGALMVGCVQSCREKLPCAIEEWQKD